VKKAWGWIVAALGALAALVSFILWRKYQKDHVDSVKDALAVAKAEREVAALDAEREMLEADIEGRGEELAIVEDKLDANRRTIVEARTGVTDLDEAGVIAEYRRLGYLK
jgi:uncharacterized membrane protein